MRPEERVERVKAAMAEAGRPDAVVGWDEHSECVSILGGGKANIWRAIALCVPDELVACWPCYRDLDTTCDHDGLTSPWPEAVR